MFLNQQTHGAVGWSGASTPRKAGGRMNPSLAPRGSVGGAGFAFPEMERSKARSLFGMYVNPVGIDVRHPPGLRSGEESPKF